MDSTTLAAYASYENNQAQIVYYLATFYNNASSARNVLYPGRATNRASYNNPVISELLDRAPTVVDPAERGAIYRQVQQIVAEEVPYVNVFYSVRQIVAVAGIGGIILDYDLNHDFKGVFVVLDD